VFVNNIQQEPGAGKSYTATGSTLTFDAAPSAGTNNVYVVYRGLAEVTTRLEIDPNSALAATTATFTGDLTVDTDTLYVDSTNNSVGIGTSSPSTSHRMTLDKSSNYGGIAFKQNGNQVGQIIQEGGTGNIYIDADSNSVGGGLVFRTTGGTTRMTVDGSGRVTKPSQPSFFAAGSGTTINNSTDTKLTFTTQVFDIGSNYTTGNSRFTAPVNGIYLFKSAVRAPLAGSNEMRFDMLFTVNGVGRAGEGQNQQNVNDASVSSTVIISLSANDYVEVWVNQNSGNNAATTNSLNLNKGGTEHPTHFCGYLIG
jgi:hypothetical protein